MIFVKRRIFCLKITTEMTEFLFLFEKNMNNMRLISVIIVKITVSWNCRGSNSFKFDNTIKKDDIKSAKVMVPLKSIKFNLLNFLLVNVSILSVFSLIKIFSYGIFIFLLMRIILKIEIGTNTKKNSLPSKIIYHISSNY